MPWIGSILLLAVLTVAPVMVTRAWAAAAAAQVTQSRSHWRGVESRIESGYFQQDAAGLRILADTLSSDGGGANVGDGKDAEWRSYYSALAAYRLALLARSDEAHAWPYAQRCVDRLNRTLMLDTVSAEALALQSACLALQSELDPWRSPLAAPLSLARIDKALRLAPDNPRVLLLGALGARERPALFGGDRQQAFALMQRAVASFERQRPAGGALPEWGAADAFTDLAQEYLRLGNALAARNVLERALLVAPDFTQARHLMAEIVSG